jgi:hypothetical protein
MGLGVELRKPHEAQRVRRCAHHQLGLSARIGRLPEYGLEWQEATCGVALGTGDSDSEEPQGGLRECEEHDDGQGRNGDETRQAAYVGA